MPAFFRTFDFANPNTHTPERPQTVSPQQALFLMNSPFVIEQAIHLEARSEGKDQDAAGRVRRIDRLFQSALGREPAIDELTDALAFVDSAEPISEAAIADRSPWQFGWGTFDEASGSVQLQPLASYTGTAWQGGPALPHPTLGWVMLTASGGHPGDAAHQAIRRWTAPAAGTLHIEGVFAHSAAQGDGVRGRIVASRGGMIGKWDVAHTNATTAPPPIAVERGDTIDFITDCRDSVDFDSFQWNVTLRLAVSENEAVQIWDSFSGFHGPIPLSRWQQLAQVLLMSNEFAFVD